MLCPSASTRLKSSSQRNNLKSLQPVWYVSLESLFPVWSHGTWLVLAASLGARQTCFHFWDVSLLKPVPRGLEQHHVTQLPNYSVASPRCLNLSVQSWLQQLRLLERWWFGVIMHVSGKKVFPPLNVALLTQESLNKHDRGVDWKMGSNRFFFFFFFLTRSRWCEAGAQHRCSNRLSCSTLIDNSTVHTWSGYTVLQRNWFRGQDALAVVQWDKISKNSKIHSMLKLWTITHPHFVQILHMFYFKWYVQHMYFYQ